MGSCRLGSELALQTGLGDGEGAAGVLRWALPPGALLQPGTACGGRLGYGPTLQTGAWEEGRWRLRLGKAGGLPGVARRGLSDLCLPDSCPPGRERLLGAAVTSHIPSSGGKTEGLPGSKCLQALIRQEARSQSETDFWNRMNHRSRIPNSIGFFLTTVKLSRHARPHPTLYTYLCLRVILWERYRYHPILQVKKKTLKTERLSNLLKDTQLGKCGAGIPTRPPGPRAHVPDHHALFSWTRIGCLKLPSWNRIRILAGELWARFRTVRLHRALRYHIPSSCLSAGGAEARGGEGSHSRSQPRPGAASGTPSCPLLPSPRCLLRLEGRPSSPHRPPSGCGAQPVPLGVFHLPPKVLMTVSPCEALINLRGRWLGGDRGLGPCADEDYGSISCGGEGTPQTFLPAIKATWLPSVALGKEKKRSPPRKEVSYALYAWQEIKTGMTRRGTVGLLCCLRWPRRVAGPGSHDPAAALGGGGGMSPGKGLEPPQLSHRQDPPPAWPGTQAVTRGPALRRVPCLVERSAITALNFLRLFEQGACGFVLHWGPPKLHNRLPHQPMATGLPPLPRAQAWGVVFLSTCFAYMVCDALQTTL